MSNTYSLLSLPDELRSGAYELASELKLAVSDGGIPLYAKYGDKPSIRKTDDAITITYNKKCEFFRMMAFIKSGLVENEYAESPRHTSLCYMADNSRNAVLTPDSARKMVRILAATGYDSFMLYTEDTFEIKDEPYFGYMRGRWSQTELKELDKYCLLFGIELIPCIQTLAHLERMFYWECYKPLIDSADILNVGDERVYTLIDKMFATCAECFSSRKINVGLDEAHTLGLGKYLDEHGFVNRSEIMSAHLKRVVEISGKYGYDIMMWSDMFFRLAFNDAYYVSEGEIPDSVISAVPENVTLIFWGYYRYDQKTFDHMLYLHKRFRNKTVFASGCHKWARFTPLTEQTMSIVSEHVDSCIAGGVTDLMNTGWGDDGAEASHFSILPSLAVYAEKAYKPDFSDEWFDRRFEDIFGIPLKAFRLIGRADYLPGFPEDNKCHTRYSKMVLYYDVLTGVFNKHIKYDCCRDYYKSLADELAPYTSNAGYGYLINTVQKLAVVDSLKANLGQDIRSCYENGDKQALRDIAEKTIPTVISAVDDFIGAYEYQWLHESRSFGLEAQQIRLGGLKERLSGIARIILAYCNGVTAHIDELEQKLLYADCRPEDSEQSENIVIKPSWNKIVTVNKI